MTTPEPLYTLNNCGIAYQLNWSLTIFWRQLPASTEWLTGLREATEPDGVRVLEHRFDQPSISQFLVSTKPAVSPHTLVRSIKGRLQYLVRQRHPKAFQRNYALRSIGTAKREDVENYVRGQTAHHPMADPRVQAIFDCYQVCNPHVDLSQPRQGAHGMYWYNLHIAFVHAERFREVREERIAATRHTVLSVAAKHGDLLSRAGIVADHVHLVLGGPPEQSPGEVALRYMNNLAYFCGMKPVFQFGFYVGTFGEYDLGVIPRLFTQSCVPPGRARRGRLSRGCLR
jgi:REP element-mobilizing transposase RayT